LRRATSTDWENNYLPNNIKNESLSENYDNIYFSCDVIDYFEEPFAEEYVHMEL
jgi:hypothetical protein